MKTFFVVNPRSANGATGKRWAELAARISRQLSDFGVEFTKGSMDAADIARRAIKSGYECVVAVGGDGTINEVVNGFFEEGRAINPSAALGVLPRGTGGDFRKTFDWDSDTDAAVRRLAVPDTRPFDVGLLEFRAHDGSTGHRYFANVCSFGVSGLVVDTVNRSSKALGGKLSFLLGSLRALSKYRDQTVRVSFDGKPAEPLKVTALAVANGRFFGGGMMVAPTADVSDGQFDVTVWSGYGLSDFVLKSGAIYRGTHTTWSGTRTLRCRTVSAQADDRVLIDCDGEQPGTLPCTMTILPSAIRLKV